MSTIFTEHTRPMPCKHGHAVFKLFDIQAHSWKKKILQTFAFRNDIMVESSAHALHLITRTHTTLHIFIWFKKSECVWILFGGIRIKMTEDNCSPDVCIFFICKPQNNFSSVVVLCLQNMVVAAWGYGDAYLQEWHKWRGRLMGTWKFTCRRKMTTNTARANIEWFISQ